MLYLPAVFDRFDFESFDRFPFRFGPSRSALSPLRLSATGTLTDYFRSVRRYDPTRFATSLDRAIRTDLAREVRAEYAQAHGVTD